MHDYDPWVFGLLAEIDHTAELRHVARAQLARQALASRAARPCAVSARGEKRYLRHFVSVFTDYSRLLFRRRAPKAP